MKTRLYKEGEVSEVPIVRNRAVEECICCGCGLTHKCIITLSKDKRRVRIKSFRNMRSTAQMRRHGMVELLNGEDNRWEMRKKPFK